MTRATSTTHLSDPTQLAQALREALTGLAADLAVLTDGDLAVSPAELGWTLRGLRPRLQTFFELLDDVPEGGVARGHNVDNGRPA